MGIEWRKDSIRDMKLMEMGITPPRDWSDLDEVRRYKLEENSVTCNSVIIKEVDVEIGGETEHFNLSTEDQANINNLFRVVELGGTQFPYQADDGKCRIYTSKEIAAIYAASQTHITTQITYHNALKAYVASLGSVDEVLAVKYGMDLPEPYNGEMLAKLKVAKEQMEAIIGKPEGAAK